MKKVAAFGKYKTIWAAAILLVLVLMSTMSTGSLKARFTSISAGNDAARMAAFVFRVQDTEGMFSIPVEINAPGEKVDYTFEVTNKDVTVCETDQKYTITMELEGSLPLVCTLTKQSRTVDNVKVSMDASEVTSVSLNGLTMASNPGEAKFGDDEAEKTVLEASTAYKDSYNLNIEWPVGEKDPKYAGGVAEVEIKIVSVQID